MAKDEHGRKVSALFGRIASWYDFLNHFLSLGQDLLWRKRLMRHIRSGNKGVMLDLAAGTLDVSRGIKKKFSGKRVLSLDFSLPMLLRGKAKLGPKYTGIFPVLGDMTQIPLPDSSVDCAAVAFGIRNVSSRELTYAEVLRVLKPGGRLCILEFGSAGTRVWKGIYNFYLNWVLPFLGKIFSGDWAAYSYLARSISEFPSPRILGMELNRAGFARFFYYPLCSGIVYVHVAEKSKFTGDKHQQDSSNNCGNAHFAQPSGAGFCQHGQDAGHFFRPDKIGDSFNNKGKA